MNARALEKIPAFPPIAAKLLRSASRPDAGYADLVHLLRADPALSAEVIRYANSALFHFSSPIRTIQQAAPLLGIQRIRALAFAAVSRTYIRGLLVMDEVRALWRYAMACALLSEMVAQYCGLTGDAAYSAGLLHDIGRLGLMVAYPAEYSALLRTVSAKLEAGEDFDLLDYERALFDTDRFTVGEWLARRWNLPEEFRAIAGRHPPPQEGQQPDLTTVVRAGCRLANSIGFGMFPRACMPSYREVVAGLPARAASRFPGNEQYLRALVDKEIEALDPNVRSDSGPAEAGMRELLTLKDAQPAEQPRPRSARDRKRTRTMWPVVLTTAAFFAIVLMALRMAGWGR